MPTTIEHFISITQAKSKLLDMVRAIHDRDDTYAITKNGVPEAVLISLARFEGLLETIEILADPELMAQLNKSREDARQGRWLDVDAVLPE